MAMHFLAFYHLDPLLSCSCCFLLFQLYLISVIQVPDIDIKKVKKCITNLIWDSGSPKVLYDVIILPVCDGGII